MASGSGGRGGGEDDGEVVIVVASVGVFVAKMIGELAGLAVGATVLLNVLFAGPISGASMNPARSLGPAIVLHRYTGIWVYILGPITGTVGGAWAYNLIRFTNKPLREITKSGSFLKSMRKNSELNGSN